MYRERSAQSHCLIWTGQWKTKVLVLINGNSSGLRNAQVAQFARNCHCWVTHRIRVLPVHVAEGSLFTGTNRKSAKGWSGELGDKRWGWTELLRTNDDDFLICGNVWNILEKVNTWPSSKGHISFFLVPYYSNALQPERSSEPAINIFLHWFID